MGILEMLVIAAIIITAVYVGYHAWENSLNSPQLDHKSINPVRLYSVDAIQKDFHFVHLMR